MEKENLYLLYGTANTGKSTTLRNLAMQIFKNFPENLIYFENIGGIDYIAVWQNENIRLGIYSGGDRKDIVFRNLSLLFDYQCNHIIGATRTKGGTCDVIEVYAQLFSKQINWIQKTAATDEDNAKCQKELLNIVKAILQ